MCQMCKYVSEWMEKFKFYKSENFNEGFQIFVRLD